MRPRVLGLTGNIGSGKSTVSKLLVEKGALLIDADALAREVTNDPAVLREIENTLGADLVKGGRLDREATARRVFADPEALKVLNSIIHPRVRERRQVAVDAARASAEAPAVIVLDIPLLYETHMEEGCDAVIVVAASLDERVRRLRASRGWSEDDIRARDAAQLPLEDKIERADYVIDNERSLADLREQVERLWDEIEADRECGSR